MTKFIDFEDSKTGEHIYQSADDIGKITVTPDDAENDTATVTIYDKKGRTLHTKGFVGGDDLARNDAMYYAKCVTDIITPVIPIAPGFSILSTGILHCSGRTVGAVDSIESKVPIVGMVTGQSQFEGYGFDILGNRHPAGGHFAILNDATGEVYCTDYPDEDRTFESAEKWVAYFAAHIRKLRAEMGIGEAERVVHPEGHHRAPAERKGPDTSPDVPDEEETTDA